MECDGYGVICGSVRPECELVFVDAWGDAGLYVFEHHSLKTLHYERGEGHRSVVG